MVGRQAAERHVTRTAIGRRSSQLGSSRHAPELVSVVPCVLVHACRWMPVNVIDRPAVSVTMSVAEYWLRSMLVCASIQRQAIGPEVPDVFGAEPTHLIGPGQRPGKRSHDVHSAHAVSPMSDAATMRLVPEDWRKVTSITGWRGR